jgi:hypothetical protein
VYRVKRRWREDARKSALSLADASPISAPDADRLAERRGNRLRRCSVVAMMNNPGDD